MGVFNIHFVAKHQKIEKKIFIFGKKISLCRKKTERRGALWDFPTSILSQNSKKIEWGILWGKKIFPEKVTMPKKLKGRTLWGVFNIHFVAKHQKIEGGFLFSEKSHSAEKTKKTERGDPLVFSNIHSVVKQQKKLTGGSFGEKIWKKSLTMPKKTERGALCDFPTSILSRNSKKIEGGTLWGKKIFPEKSHNAEKPERGPFGLAWYGMLRGKTGKTFLVQFARPNGAIIFCRTILVSSGGL